MRFLLFLILILLVDRAFAITYGTTTYFHSVLDATDYGAKGNDSHDDAPNIQKAITASKGRYVVNLASGIYRCYSQLINNTTGQGVVDGLKIQGQGTYSTILKNMTNGPLFLITSSTTASDFQDDVYVANLSITSTQTAAGGMGIQLHGIRRSVFENIYMTGFSSHCIHLASTGTDKDNASIIIQNCELDNSLGSGIYSDGGSANVNSMVFVKHNRLIGNLNGMVMIGQTNGTVEGNAIAYNTSTGLFVSNGLTANGNFTKNIVITNNEFDTNNQTQVALSGAESVDFDHNYFIANVGVIGSTFVTGVSLSNTFNVTFHNNQPRIGVGLSGITMYKINSNANYTTINDTDWTAWVNTGNTKFSDSGIQTVIVDSGQGLKPSRQNVFTSADNVPATWIIPNSSSTFQRVVIGTTTLVTISTPVYAEGGAYFDLLIWNTAATGATTFFVPIYSTSTWTNPLVSGSIRTGRFLYDSGSVKWRQIGAWSGDEK